VRLRHTDRVLDGGAGGPAGLDDVPAALERLRADMRDGLAGPGRAVTR
jgi:hypothetical protein